MMIFYLSIFEGEDISLLTFYVLIVLFTVKLNVYQGWDGHETSKCNALKNYWNKMRP